MLVQVGHRYEKHSGDGMTGVRATSGSLGCKSQRLRLLAEQSAPSDFPSLGLCFAVRWMGLRIVLPCGVALKTNRARSLARPGWAGEADERQHCHRRGPELGTEGVRFLWGVMRTSSD